MLGKIATIPEFTWNLYTCCYLFDTMFEQQELPHEHLLFMSTMKMI